ncbi:PREDICTED: uncharacterized protein LOC109234665 [Nicotiana attenuata]|nr:PREDICTED: uncharacterized protein LOC109234665 [Nicotiana attenuata]
MKARYFYFTVHSASDLQDVREFGRMKVYAKVSIAGKTKCTEVDRLNETNPKWNARLCFIVPEKDIIKGSTIPSKIELFCKRTFSHDKYVGELLVSLAPRYKGECTFPVRRNDSNESKSFGTLTFSHALGDKFIVANSSSSSSSSSVKDNNLLIDIINIGVDLANIAMATEEEEEEDYDDDVEEEEEDLL